MSQQKLAQEIVSRSEATTWEVAKKEWELVGIYRANEPETCLCGHNPIWELCELRNTLNGQHATVGNVCVSKFMGIQSESIFRGFKRILEDQTKAPGAEALIFALEKNWITQWEYDFSCNTFRKRSLTGKQMNIRQQINEKLLKRLQR